VSRCHCHVKKLRYLPTLRRKGEAEIGATRDCASNSARVTVRWRDVTWLKLTSAVNDRTMSETVKGNNASEMTALKKARILVLFLMIPGVLVFFLAVRVIPPVTGRVVDAITRQSVREVRVRADARPASRSNPRFSGGGLWQSAAEDQKLGARFLALLRIFCRRMPHSICLYPFREFDLSNGSLAVRLSLCEVRVNSEVRCARQLICKLTHRHGNHQTAGNLFLGS
jgi:hypothetical protein